MQVQDAVPLLLARVWRILEQPILVIAEDRKRWGTGGDAVSGMEAEMAKALEAVDPNHELVKQYKEKMENPQQQ